jgi:hypothetical protein
VAALLSEVLGLPAEPLEASWSRRCICEWKALGDVVPLLPRRALSPREDTNASLFTVLAQDGVGVRAAGAARPRLWKW